MDDGKDIPDMISEEIRVVRKRFSITLHPDRFDLDVYGSRFFSFSPVSAVSLKGKRDVESTEPLSLRCSEQGEEMTAVWTSGSSLWKKKEYRLRIGEDSFFYTVSVSGAGAPWDVDYFSGAALAGKAGGWYETSEYLLTQPRAGIENHIFSMAEDNRIAMQLMVPPPLCFPFRKEGARGWLGIGLAAEDGSYAFDGFSYRNINGRARFLTELYGALKVDGAWTAPGIFGCAADDEWEVLSGYAAWHYRNGCHASGHPRARWWYGPFFCGWGEQAILKWKYHTDIYGAASQAAYTEMSLHLDALDLHPTAIILDDKWQEEYGTFLPDPKKWPDLRGFVDHEHEKGRRVLLWYRCWSPEGLDPEECMLKDGEPVAGDPTSPRFIERIERTVRTLLSDEADGFGCDGFKIDFADCVPVGDDLSTWEAGVRGIELVKRLVGLIYGAAKKTKADALVSCSGCHPYFADVTDMARLHDYDLRLRSVERCMSFRQRLYRIMLPDALIDTDFPSFAGHEESMKYLRYAPALGVPDLYRLSDTGECRFTEEDFAQVRAIWAGYAEQISKLYEKNP